MRRRQRRRAAATPAGLAVLWSVEAIVVADTDWSRLAARRSARRSALHGVRRELLPTSSTRRSTRADGHARDAAGLLLALPVAWLGAATSRRSAS
jgi:hypothetical protein